MIFEHNDPLSDAQRKEDIEKRLKRSFSRRIFFLISMVCVGLAGLFARVFYLQVLHYDYYRTRARSNRVRIKPLVPERGIIYDRKGIALTENILRYQAVVNPSQVEGSIDTLLQKIVRVFPLSQEEQAQFLKRYKRTRRYDSVVLKSPLTEDDYYHLSLNLYQLEGVEIIPYYERYYPHGAVVAHILGYTNRINEEDLKTIDEEAYRGMDNIGRQGIEKQYETQLKGAVGLQQVETDANGNMVRILQEKPALRGEDLYLSLDLALQKFIYQRFGEFRGSCVAIEPKTGEVLAMVSKPGYDNNLFVRGISSKQYQRLLNDPHGPLFDRALKGMYSPGSVIKPAMLLAGLYYRVVDGVQKINCTGHYQLPDSKTERRFHCWKRSGHGPLNGDQAMAQSCDVYFYNVGYRLGIDRIDSYFKELGVGSPTGIDLPGEGSGILPSRTWKEERYKTVWYQGDTINLSIGQGFLTLTPLQLAYMTTLFARKGKKFTPHLLKQVFDPKTQQFSAITPNDEGWVSVYRSDHWDYVRQTMEDVMHRRDGTGFKAAFGAPYRMAGKSGTVQVISFKNNTRIESKHLAKEHQDNAMFIAYAPADDPKIALSIVVERGGGGASTAAPIIRDICDFYLGVAAHDTNNNLKEGSEHDR